MESIEAKLERAERLYAVTQRIGFTLWQVQELESCAAHYFVLVAQAQKGMGTSAGYELLTKALGKTFGATIHQMCKSGLLSQDLETRFRDLLLERNWLVHKSRATNRNVIRSDDAMQVFLNRLDEMTEESGKLLSEILALTESHVKKLGITQQQIDEAAVSLVEQWYGPNTI